jgi:DNA invertase Pin-like site-specific DNA recombinase
LRRQKQAGKYKGRVPTARRLEKEIQSLHLQGMSPSMIAKELTIGVASVYRYRNQSVM